MHADLQMQHNMLCMIVYYCPLLHGEQSLITNYSGSSDKGPSEIETTSLQRTLVAAPC